MSALIERAEHEVSRERWLTVEQVCHMLRLKKSRIYYSG